MIELKVVFGEQVPPQQPNRPDYDWREVARQLKDQPKVWAQIVAPEDSVDPWRGITSHHIGGPSMVLSSFRPAGSFQARLVLGQLWARYLGEAS